MHCRCRRHAGRIKAEKRTVLQPNLRHTQCKQPTSVRVTDSCLSGTWTLGQLSKCHLDTRTAVRVALGHSDNCPSGTQTLGQLSELHLDTRTAVRVQSNTCTAVRSTSDKVQSGLRVPAHLVGSIIQSDATCNEPKHLYTDCCFDKSTNRFPADDVLLRPWLEG